MNPTGLSDADRERIQRFADEHGLVVHMVGSRARGTHRPDSDYDYVLGPDGGNRRQRIRARSQLPRGPAGGEVSASGGDTGIDVINEPLRPTEVTIPFHPSTVKGQP